MRINPLFTGVLFLAASLMTGPAATSIPKTDVIWAGLDYSLVRMIGNEDFRDTDKIFPDMLNAWNDLFLKEMIGKSEKSLKRNLILDINGMRSRNAMATADQIVREDGEYDKYVKASHLTREDLAAAVKSYELEHTSGVALVFVVDRLVKLHQSGAVHIVFFDVESREIIATDRYITKAGGFGFRNYWFRVVKEAVPKLSKYR